MGAVMEDYRALPFREFPRDALFTLSAALTVIVQSGLAVDSVTSEPPSLEEVYLILTGGPVRGV